MVPKWAPHLSWAHLRATWDHLGASGSHLGTSWGLLGTILGPFGGHLGTSWGHLGASLWPSWGHLGELSRHHAREAPEATASQARKRRALGQLLAAATWHDDSGYLERALFFHSRGRGPLVLSGHSYGAAGAAVAPGARCCAQRAHLLRALPRAMGSETCLPNLGSIGAKPSRWVCSQSSCFI